MGALTLMILLAGLARAAEAPEAAPPPDPLGIPAAVPWQDPALAEKVVVKKENELDRESELREALAESLRSVEAERDGLLLALRFARVHPEVFPPVPLQRPGGLYDEYAELAVRTWLFAADHYRALESLVGDCRELGAVKAGALRREAFACAASARLAQERFLKEWLELVRRDPAVEEALRGSQEPGLPAGFFGELEKRAAGAQAAAVLGAYADKTGAFRSLEHALPGEGLKSWIQRRQEDFKSVGAKKLRRAPSLPEVLEALKTDPLVSRPGAWSGRAPGLLEKPPAEEEVPGSALDAQRRGTDWADLPVSSQIVVVVNRVKAAVAPDPPQGPRPQTLISRRQVEDLKASLEPGDILLVRRERFVEETGMGGYWRSGAVFAATPGLRRRFFGSETLNGEFYGLNTDAFTLNAAERDPEVPDSILVRGETFALKPLSSAAAGDAAAVLRPRLHAEAKADALRSLFGRLGRPCRSLCELLRLAYGERLRWPLRPVLGRPLFSANDLVRQFDEEFGTEKAQYDLVVFLDAEETLHKSVLSSVEEFRASWRRPAWRPAAKAAEERTGGRP
ncbi:MAG TPA: hypothetical protein DCM05_13945 [Elusimicrobia bacterium]|nr:hypothetical protein [Elusimicrobiota bacterium]